MIFVFFIISLLHIIPFFINSNFFWGTHFFLFFNPIYIILSILIVIFSFTKQFKQKIEKFLRSFFKIDFRYRVLIILFFSFLSFYFLSSSTHFLGDGYLRIRNLEGGRFFAAQEPLDTFIHQIIYQLLKEPFGFTTENTYRIISIFCGLISIIYILKFIELLKIDSIKKGLTLLIYLTLSTNYLFFGYVESYSIFVMLLILYSYYGYRFINENRFFNVVMILLYLLIITHVLGLLIIPSYIYLNLISLKKQKISKLIYLNSLGLLIIFLFFMLISYYTGDEIINKLLNMSSQSIFLPIFSNQLSYGIFSLYHIIDILNEFLLVFPFGLSFVIFFKEIDKEKYNYFYLAMLIPFLLFILFVKPNLGFARDWDLFSIYGIPLFFLSILIILKSNILANRFFYPLIIVCLIHTISFIILNSNDLTSVKRMESLVTTNYWDNKSKALLYDELAHYYKNKGNFYKAEIYSNDAYKYEKNPRYLYRNAMIYLAQINTIKAEFYLKELSKTNYNKGEILNLLADLYYDIGNYDSALVYYNKNLKVEPNNFLALNNTGLILMNQLKFEEAIEYFQKSIKISPNDSYVYYYIAVCYFNQNNFEEALKYAKLSEQYGYKKSIISSFLNEIQRKLGEK